MIRTKIRNLCYLQECYNLSTKPINLKKLRMLVWFRASSSVVELLCLGHLMIMCSIVMGVLHESHIGFGSLVIKKEWVILEWHILALLIIICSLLEAFSGYDHFVTVFLMFLSLLLVNYAQLFFKKNYLSTLPIINSAVYCS